MIKRLVFFMPKTAIDAVFLVMVRNYSLGCNEIGAVVTNT
jgi:hypothetical protein